jgi:hypothetical protein
LKKRRVPQGRLKNPVFAKAATWQASFSVVPTGLVAITSDPGVQTPGYFQNVPVGRGVFRLQKN